jgi:hypothetical protein
MRLVGLVCGSLALVASLLLISLTMWLQTAAGRGWIERALVREASERLGLTLSVGRTTGSVIRGIRLEQVALNDAQGRLVARAGAVSARYRLFRLIRLHEFGEIALERPVIVRLPSAAARADPPHGEPTAFWVRNLTITDGSFRWQGRTAHHLFASAAVDARRPGAQRIEGDVDLIFDEQRLFVRANAELGAHLQISAELHGAGFAARGHGDWADGRLNASLEVLHVDPKLVEATRPWAGRGALRAQGTVVGPLDALDLKLQGHTDNRGIQLAALVDVPRRTACLTASVAAPRRSAKLRARGALHGRALDLAALEVHIGATRLTGAAHVGAGRLDATLDARVAPAEAAVIGIHPVAPIRLRVLLQGPARALGVRIRGQLRAAQVALAGRIDLPARRGQVRFVAHDVRLWEIVPRAPTLAFSGAFTFDGAVRESNGVAGKMSVTDGSLRVAGLSFKRLYGSGRVRLGQSGEAHVEALSGQLEGRRPRQIETQTVIRWDGRSLRCDSSRVILDGSRATGTVVYTDYPVKRQPLVTVRAQTLSLSPELVQELLHRRPSSAWPGNATLVWTPDEYRLTFALDTDQGPASGQARLRLDRGALELPSVDVALGGSRLRGAARVKNGEIVASIDELLLHPRLAHALWPSLEPARPARIRGAVAGPLHALDINLLVTGGGSSAMLRGRVNLRARSFELRAALDTFYFHIIRQTWTSRVNVELSLVGRLVDGGVAGTLTMHHASGIIYGLPLSNARVDATLNGPKFNVDHVLVGVPGAVLEGSGGGSWRDFHVGYGVVVTDALELKKVPKDVRVIIGLTAWVPGRSVVGAMRRHAGGKIEFTHHIIPPPFRWVNLLYHALTGHPLHLTVQ